MNKYQKEKSREIRDIMRTDKFGRITYKEAKRKWRKGVRAFRVGSDWITKDLSHLRFSRRKLKKLGACCHRILKYCAERNLDLKCQYEHFTDSYELRFYGRSVNGKRYVVCYCVSCDVLRQYGGSLSDVTHRILDEVNCRLQQFIFPSAIKEPDHLHPRMTIHPWDYRCAEDVFRKIIVK